jgi:hypothetical protein
MESIELFHQLLSWVSARCSARLGGRSEKVAGLFRLKLTVELTPELRTVLSSRRPKLLDLAPDADCEVTVMRQTPV